MSEDFAGNSFETGGNLNLTPSIHTFGDSGSPLDTREQYSLTPGGSSSFNLSLDEKSVNADVEQLNSTSEVLPTSALLGINGQSLYKTADATAPNQEATLPQNWDSLTAFGEPMFETGVFTVGPKGEVGVDFLLDGGKYQGELAIFSLKGIDQFELGSVDFIQEAARRALTNSDLGYVVINDLTEGARFHCSFAWEDDSNSGDYQGVKTFLMRPGDQFGVMLVPNGTVQQVFDNPFVDGATRPLFSLATANPNDAFHVGQIADVTGEGNTFVMEDLRVDGWIDKDYNDIIFQVRGATARAVQLDEVIKPAYDWRGSDLGQALIAYAKPYVTSAEPIQSDPIVSPPINSDVTSAKPIDAVPIVSPPLDTNPVVTPPVNSDVTSAKPIDAVPIVSPPLDTNPVVTAPVDSKSVSFDFPASNQPLVGVIDTGFSGNNPDIDYSRIILGRDRISNDDNPLLQPGEGNEHGTHVLGIIGATQNNGIGIDGVNDKAPIWVGRGVGAGQWAESLVDFVNAARDSNQPNAVVNLSMDLTQVNPDGSVTTRYELTPAERSALEYARQSNVLVVVATGNDGGVMSALGQASQEFDNIITVGAAERVNDQIALSKAYDRTEYSSYGYGLDIMAPGGTVDKPKLSLTGDGVGTMAGTSVATAKVTGAMSQVWAANPDLSYRQVIEIIKNTATDLGTPGWDTETGAGLLNIAAAVHLAKATKPEVNYDLTFENLPDDEMSVNLDAAFETALPGFNNVSELDDEDLSSLTAEELAAYEEAVREISSELNEYLARAGQKIALEHAANNFGMQVEAMEQLLDVLDEKTLESLAQAQDLLRENGFNAALELKTLAIASNFNNEAIGNVNFIPSERLVAVPVPAFNAQILNAGYASQVGFLRVRSGPGTNYLEVGRKYPGETVTFDAFENNGTWVPDPFMPGGGSSRWYKIAGTNQWMSALYFNNTPEQADQERARQEAIRRAEEEARLAAEAAQRAAEAARLAAEAAQRALEEALRRAQEEALRHAAEVEANTAYWIAQSSPSPTPQKHIEYEVLAKQEVYKDYKEEDNVQGYRVEKVFKDSSTGLYAMGLIQDGKPPILVFRGTNENIDWVANAHPGGVGVGQYNAALRLGIEQWIQGKGTKPDVIGHSLGGALAQLTAADFSQQLGETVTFNAPGVSFDRFLRFKGGQIAHYISPTDIVSRSGFGFLPGKVYEMRFKGGPLQQHTNIFLNDSNTICIPVTKHEISDRNLAWQLSRIPSEQLRLGVGSLFYGGYLVTNTFNLSAYYGQALNGISQGIKDGTDAVGSFINEGILALQRKAQEAQEIANAALERVKQVRQFAQAKVQQAKAAYQTFKQETQKRVSEVIQYSQQKIQQAAQKVAQTIQNAAPKVAQAVTKFVKGAVNTVKNVVNAGKQIVNNVIEAGKQIVNNVIEAGKQIVNTVKTVVHDTYNAGVKLVNETAKTVQNAVSSTVNTVAKGFNRFKSAFGF